MRLSLALGVALWLSFTAAQVKPAEPLTVGRLVLLAGEGTASVSLMNEAFVHADPRIRAVAARLVATFGAKTLRPQIEAALVKESDPVAGAEFVRALMFLAGTEAIPAVEPHARRLGPLARMPIYERLATTQPDAFATALPEILQQLGAVEGRRLEDLVATVANLLGRPELTRTFRSGVKIDPDGYRPAADLPVTERLLSQWLPGLLADAARVAGCPLSQQAVFGYARVRLLPDGRVRALELETRELPPSCALVLTGLTRLTIADGDRLLPPDLWQVLVLPFTEDFAACAPVTRYADHAGWGGPGSSGPKKIKDVRPTYPPHLQEEEVGGLTVLDTIVTETGCVQAARVIRSPAVGLSLAALRAVSGWRFDAPRTGGQAMPFRMLATVNFAPE